MSTDVSVIVPTHNRAAYLDRSLRSLLSQTRGGYEVIVVADDCSDNTDDVVERHGAQAQVPVRIVQCRERSASRARNRGLAHASGRFCLFLDSDIVVPGDYVERLVPELAARAATVLLTPVYGNAASTTTWPFLVDDDAALDSLDRDDLLRWAATQARLGDLRTALSDPETGLLDHLSAPWAFCWSSALALERTLATKVGGFNDSFEMKGSEDIEFGMRLANAGARFALFRAAHVLHIPHERDRECEERYDLQHDRLLLATYPTAEVEALCAFDCANVNPMLGMLSEWHAPLNELARVVANCRPNSSLLGPLEIDLVLGPAPWLNVDDGHCRIVYPRPLAGVRQLPLFGFALPFDDQALRTLLLVGLWQVLPERLAARLFAEALRVAEIVYLLKHPSFSAITLPVAIERLAAHDAPYWERTRSVKRSYYDFRPDLIEKDGDWTLYRLERGS